MNKFKLGLILAATTCAMSAFAQERAITQPSLISVSGSGTVRVDPDLATVRLGVVAESKNAADAQNRVNAVGQKILDVVLKLGIDRKDVQTSSLTLYPIMGQTNPNDPTPRLLSYRAGNTVSVRVKDLTKVGAVIDAAIGVGSNDVQGIEFGLLDDSSAKRQALKNAVKSARDKATAIAEALGVALGAVYQVREGSVSAPPVFLARGAMMSAPAVAAPVSPGQLDVTAEVSIDYRIGSDR